MGLEPWGIYPESAESLVVSPGEKVELRGDHSRDPDGVIRKYAWRLISHPAGSAARLEIGGPERQRALIVPDLLGRYEAELLVWDNCGTASNPSCKVVIDVEAPVGLDVRGSGWLWPLDDDARDDWESLWVELLVVDSKGERVCRPRRGLQERGADPRRAVVERFEPGDAYRIGLLLGEGEGPAEVHGGVIVRLNGREIAWLPAPSPVAVGTYWEAAQFVPSTGRLEVLGHLSEPPPARTCR